MRKKDILYPFVSTAILFSMLAFLSCAHKARVQGQDDNKATEVAEGQNPENPSNADDLSQLADNNGQPVDGNTPPADGLTDNLDNKPPSDVANNDVNPQDSLSNSDLGSLDNNAATTPAEPPPSDLNQPSVAQNETAITPDAPAETAPVAPAPQKEWKGSHVPTIPTSAIQRKGALLNRFYFARQGDSPESVSELIYGSADRAGDLTKWNSSKLAFKPGRVVYYQSASMPQDEEMKSFYQEKNITPEDYVVRKGDWLSKIAQGKYGSSDSWKEVAVINGMQSPDALNVGQKLAMYPADLKSSQPVTEQPKVADNKPVEVPQAAPAPEMNTQAPQAAAPQMNTQTLPPPSLPEGKAPTFGGEPTTKPLSKKKNEGLDIAKLIEQNLFAVAMGGLILLLVVALTAVNRRRRARNEELGDDVLPISARRK